MPLTSSKALMTIMQSSRNMSWGLCLLLAGALLVAGQSSAGSGKMYPPMLTADVPNPVAFFPLTEGEGTTVTSFPDGTYNGTLQGSMPWNNDEVFGSVLSCNREAQNLIVLDPVDYASMGPFTVNLWERANATDQDGDLFEYIYSHSAYASRDNFANVDAFHPNQIQVYLPENQHPAAGLVRTVVKDSTDLDTAAFMDSDGHYNDNSARTRINGNPVNDGAWHMITLTTRSDGSAGYLVYVDGLLKASLPGKGPNAVNATMANPDLLVDGGRPIFLQNGTIYLCGRSDGDASRSFSGSVSHVGMWNTVLSATQILDLYKTVVVATASQFRSTAAAPAAAPLAAAAPDAQVAAAPRFTGAATPITAPLQLPAASPISSIMVAASPLEAPQQLTIAGRPCQFPFFYRGVAHSSCVAYTSADSSSFCMDVDGRFAMCSPAPLSPYSTFQSWLDQWAGKGALQTANGMNGMQEVITCNVSTATGDQSSACGQGYVCAPLPTADIRAANNAAASASNWGLSPTSTSTKGAAQGVCASPDGVALPVGPTVPVPTAYFPLTNGSTSSWPIPEYWAYNTSVVKSKQSQFVIDSFFGTVVQCNATAGSSLAIEGVQWGRQGPFALNIWVKQLTDNGNLFQYIISTRNRTLGNITDDSIFYPNQVHLYLPGADHPAHDTVRAIVKDDTDKFTGDGSRVWLDSDGVVGSNNERSTIRTPLLGGWHMITISTLTSGDTGFRLYIDGLFTASLSRPQDFFQIDGGRAIYADGAITLCDRADRTPGRGFDGRLAQLAIYDAALTESNIALLYEAVTGQTPDYSKSPAAQAAAQPPASSAQPVAAPSQANAAAPSQSIAASPKPALAVAGSSPSPNLDISVYDLTGLPGGGSQAPGSSNPVPNPAVVKQPVDVSGTATDAHRVGVNGASAGPSGMKLAPGAVAGIAVAGLAVLALAAGIAALVVRKRRHGGNWHKAQLEGGPRPGGPPGPGAGNAAQTSFPDTQQVPKRPSPGKAKLFTGPPSNTFQLEANSTL